MAIDPKVVKRKKMKCMPLLFDKTKSILDLTDVDPKTAEFNLLLLLRALDDNGNDIQTNNLIFAQNHVYRVDRKSLKIISDIFDHPNAHGITHLKLFFGELSMGGQFHNDDKKDLNDLFQVIAKHDRLTSLTIDGVVFNRLWALMKYFETTQRLSELNLHDMEQHRGSFIFSKIGLTHGFAIEFRESLENNKSLKILRIFGHTLSAKGYYGNCDNHHTEYSSDIDDIKEFLTERSSMRYLDISGKDGRTCFMDRDVPKLKEMVESLNKNKENVRFVPLSARQKVSLLFCKDGGTSPVRKVNRRVLRSIMDQHVKQGYYQLIYDVDMRSYLSTLVIVCKSLY